MYGCESWTVKKAECQRIDAFELYCKEIKPVHPKGHQSWIFIGRTDAKAGAPVLWPPDAKSQLIGKDPDAGKDWGQEEKGATEDEMVGWHHQFSGHELEQIPGDNEGQGSLACCSLWSRKESDTTERQNDKFTLYFIISNWENVCFIVIFFFYWNVIALQCYINLCYTTMWISCMHTYIHEPLEPPSHPPHPSHPSRSSQSTKLSSLCYTAA